MGNKMKYVAIVLFLLISLTVFTFANPAEEGQELDANNNALVQEQNDNADKKVEQNIIPNSETINIVNNLIVDDEKLEEKEEDEKKEEKLDLSYEIAKKAIEKVEESLSLNDFNIAERLLEFVKDLVGKTDLINRLEKVNETINAIRLVNDLEEKVSSSNNKDDLKEATAYRDENEVENKVVNLTNPKIKNELIKKLNKINEKLNDNSAPIISGVTNGEVTKNDVLITVDEEDVIVTVKLNGTKIDNKTTFTEEGEYVYEVVDKAFNVASVTFTIDKTNPVFNNLVSGVHYKEITLDVTDDTNVIFKVENKDNNTTYELKNNDKLVEDATYYITATDEAGNSTSIWVAIDSVFPTISGIENNKVTSESTTITIEDKFLMSVTIDEHEFTRDDFVSAGKNEDFTFVYEIGDEGIHTIIAKDKMGNTEELTFTLDTTAPTINLKGTVGLNKNEYRIEAGTEVSIEDIMATATDNFDTKVDVKIVSVDFYAPSKYPERNVYGYDFTSGFKTNIVGRYNIKFKATDDALNTSTKIMLLVINDTTAPSITIKGTAGRNKNELIVSQDDVVTLEDVIAISNDIVDGKKDLYPNKITRYYPGETGKPSHSYDAINGFDTKTPGYYIINYSVTDEAGNKASKNMLLVVTVTKSPEVVNGVSSLYGNLTLIDRSYYSNNTNTSNVTIDGNGYTVTQNVTSEDKFNWNGPIPTLANVFSSSNGSTITVKDITFKGTVQSILLGHYVAGKEAQQANFNTKLENVNIVGLNVVSLSDNPNLSPAVFVYGNATLDNVKIYGTKLSKLDTFPRHPIYDLALFNYSNTVINNSKIGSIFTWHHAKLTLNNTTVDTILTQTTHTKGGEIVVGNGSKVGTIVANYDKKINIIVKAGATVDTIDLSNVKDLASCTINYEPGTVNNIIYP